MRVAANFLTLAAVLASAFSSPTTRETDGREFEAAHVGLIISPLMSIGEIRQIQVYWSNSCFRSGDQIALYREKPSETAQAVWSMKPTSGSGIAHTGLMADFVPSSKLTFQRQCLGYHVAWLRDGTIMKTNCLETRPNWMEHRKNEIGPKTFSEIFLPGTHDSGAYAIHEGVGRDNRVSKYVICQDEDILAQLIYGARYLDIRVGHYNDKKSPFYVNHGVVRVHPMQTVIDHVKTFLSNTQEIVIFDVQEFSVGFGRDMKIHNKFIAYLEQQFADYLLPKSYGWSASLDTIWASGKRLIIGYDQSSVVAFHDSIWPCVTQQWGNVRTISALYKYLNGIETNALSSPVVNPRSAMAELTPKTFDVILDRFGGLRQMAENVNINVTNWYNTKWQNTANIVAVDFFKGTGIIETAIEWNDRRFSKAVYSAYTCSAK